MITHIHGPFQQMYWKGKAMWKQGRPYDEENKEDVHFNGLYADW